MAWVKSEYAGELAVVATWLTALLPWSVSVLPTNFGQPIIAIRFLFFRYRSIPPVEIDGEVETGGLTLVHRVFELEAFPTLKLASQVWLAGAVLFLLPLALSVAYYVLDDELEAKLPVDPVRLMGGLLGATAVVFTGATVGFLLEQPKVTLPIGVVLMWAIAVTLLRVDRT
jgi:uncharacterized protein (TIGR04206 family)